MSRRPSILLLDSSAGECELFRIALPSGNTRGCMTKAKSLAHLRRAAIEMTKWMETDPELDLMDQILIENSIQMLQITYTNWKSRNAKAQGMRKREIKDVA
jgi:hypothetical protein